MPGIKVINGDPKEDPVTYSRTFGLHGTISAVVAAAILVFSGFVLDRVHLISAPAGIVEVGELAPFEARPNVAILDEIVVSG